MRIMIFGRPGSGKSTLASALSKKLKIPVHHLDKHYFTANWVLRDYNEFLAIQQNFVNQDSWIIEGCSLQSIEMRYERANVCIYLQYPRWLCLYRLFKRNFFKDKSIDDRAEGCKESVSWKLIQYTWTFEYRKNNRLTGQLAMLKSKYPHVKFYTAKNNRDIKLITNILTST